MTDPFMQPPSNKILKYRIKYYHRLSPSGYPEEGEVKTYKVLDSRRGRFMCAEVELYNGVILVVAVPLEGFTNEDEDNSRDEALNTIHRQVWQYFTLDPHNVTISYLPMHATESPDK